MEQQQLTTIEDERIRRMLHNKIQELKGAWDDCVGIDFTVFVYCSWLLKTLIISIIKDAIRREGMGVHGISKDFVPINSTNPDIRRAVNSYSRKCTAVWLDRLPRWLEEQLEEGEITKQWKKVRSGRSTIMQYTTTNKLGIA